MLCLSRTKDEGLAIETSPGVFVRVTVLQVRNGIVKLGIDAPAEMEIHRNEVWERIAKEQDDA